MTHPRRVCAFGALNSDSYDVFARFLRSKAQETGVDVDIALASPYPNARAVSEPGRPLRAEALADDTKRQELYAAVAGDARAIGAVDADVAVMPCMSMIGFHDGIEAALGRSIMRLSDALRFAYRDIDRVGVLHMRPAKKSVEEIFGAALVAPDDAQAARLLAAEEDAKRTGTPAPVEAEMKKIAEEWRAGGVNHVLFARADAPRAILGPAARIDSVNVRSVFDVLADRVAAALL